MAEIKPALTEGEWLDGPRVAVQRGGLGIYDQMKPPGEGALGLENVGTGTGIVVSPEHRHALAAVALYNQDYGFNWSEIYRLRWAAAQVEGLADAATGQTLRHLADKIAAMLPPE